MHQGRVHKNFLHSDRIRVWVLQPEIGPKTSSSEAELHSQQVSFQLAANMNKEITNYGLGARTCLCTSVMNNTSW